MHYIKIWTKDSRLIQLLERGSDFSSQTLKMASRGKSVEHSTTSIIVEDTNTGTDHLSRRRGHGG